MCFASCLANKLDSHTEQDLETICSVQTEQSHLMDSEKTTEL